MKPTQLYDDGMRVTVLDPGEATMLSIALGGKRSADHHWSALAAHDAAQLRLDEEAGA